MHFSEDDLRSALQRKDPGTTFTRHVMARVNREPEQMSARQTEKPHTLRGLWWSPLRRVLVGAFLAVLVAVGWGGIAKYREAEERHAGELAGEQAVAALRITTKKLNHVIERVQTAPAQTKGGSDEEN